MSNDARQEDTVLGSALRRAIETQPVRATPFTESRVAMRLAGRERRSPLLPVLAAAAAVVLGLALGAALLGQRGGEPGPVASSPTPSPGATASPGSSPAPSPTEGPDRIWVFFARDQLPPVGAFIRGTFMAADSQQRIISRLIELRRASGGEVPSGATNVVSQLAGPDRTFVLDVRIEGDLATVDFGADTFDSIRGAAQTQAVLQQLVYTITEEVGVRRAFIREAGRNATVDQLVIDKPLKREDVLPYEGVKTEESVRLEESEVIADVTVWDPGRGEVTPGLGRFVIELRAKTTPEGGFWAPSADVRLELGRNSNENELGKWTLRVEMVDARWPQAPGEAFHCCPFKRPESGPIRQVAAYPLGQGSPDEGVGFGIDLDDARPWRVSLEPGQPGTMRLIVDIGGHPQAISASVAVYGPKPGDEVARTFTLTGTARAFEAHVAWRLKDASQREVASGFTTASIGTSPVWGTFTTEVKVPDGVSGNVTLEVFWPSPRDGADVDTVAIPLRVR